jgi:hypothetical protein
MLVCQLEGSLVAYQINALTKGVLLAGPAHIELARRLVAEGAQLIEQSRLALRLGVALYDRPFLFIPQSIIDEAGRTFQGEIVFDWLRAQTYDMPRSEVFGVNAAGKPDQVFARDVDVESSPIVVGGPDASPLYIACLIGEAQLPPRFARALKSVPISQLNELRQILESV